MEKYYVVKVECGEADKVYECKDELAATKKMILEFLRYEYSMENMYADELGYSFDFEEFCSTTLKIVNGYGKCSIDKKHCYDTDKEFDFYVVKMEV